MQQFRILVAVTGVAVFHVCSFCAENLASAENLVVGKYAIVIHGGCGSGERLADEAVQQDYLNSLKAALSLGQKLLDEGAASLDVVEKVARAMEDDPNFNAGKGAAFNREGRHELDASIMDGRTLACGAVAGATTAKNPISLARLVMERTEHVLLAGAGADQFAEAMNVDRVEPDYYFTPRLRKLWEDRQDQQTTGSAQLDHGGSRGTIGVVALDKNGNLAAATSTGGLSFKMPGRVGDSPIIGAGTYAKNGVCAVSCTGRGEEFIRHSVAHTLAALVEYKQVSLDEAARQIIDETLARDVGGLIAVGADGSIAMPFNTRVMLRAAADASGRFEVKIWPDN
jgi:beta-aspartyl-peptidase (threonine type)